MDCGTQCVKYLLCFFNFIFALSGIALIAVGAIVKLHLGKTLNIMVPDVYTATPILLIIVGCIVFVISFFGCCGAAKENQCMIVTFSVLLGIIFIIELAVGIAAYALQDQVVDAAKKEVNNTFYQYSQNEQYREAWDGLQIALQCCGINGPTDWEHVGNKTIPKSCCATKDCTPSVATSWTGGCYKAVPDYVRSNLKTVGGIGIGIAFVEVLGIIFACCLACGIKNR